MNPKKNPINEDVRATSGEQVAAEDGSGGSGDTGNSRLLRLAPEFCINALLLTFVLSTFGIGIYLLFHWLPSWEHRLLFGLMTVSVLALLPTAIKLGGTGKRSSDDVIADAASAEEQQAAIEHLASLPHFRKLRDGSLFDYLQGSRIMPCRCGDGLPFHLMVRYGKGWRHGIALVSRGALTQYLSVQDAVAIGLRQLTKKEQGCDPAA